MMDALLPIARKNGYQPDSCVCPDEVPAGRPYPWMCFQNAIHLQTFPLCSMIKVGDTIPDIEEGLNAGMWTIGIALTGNLLGMTEDEVNSLSQHELNEHKKRIYQQFYQAGAHFVVDSIKDIPQVIEEIYELLHLGYKP